MNSGANVKKIFLVLSLSIMFHCCATYPPNLGVVKEEVVNYYSSGKFEEELNNVIDKAIKQFNDIDVKDSSLIVFDIDETALSNYSFDKSVDFGNVPYLWNKWADSAKAPAVSTVKHLYDFLIKKGFRVAFVTGRGKALYEASYKNLQSAGYTKFDTLIVRNSAEKSLTALEYKSKKRVELTKKGYTIAGDIGDQYSDLEGPYHGIQVKIPNYIYILK